MVAAFFSAFLLRAASFCQTFTAGDSYTCGSGGRTGCVSCAVRGRGDGEAGSNLIDYIRFRTIFKILKKKILFENEIHGIYLTDTPNGRKCPFGCSGYVTAVAVGQSQRLYSKMGYINHKWY